MRAKLLTDQYIWFAERVQVDKSVHFVQLTTWSVRFPGSELMPILESILWQLCRDCSWILLNWPRAMLIAGQRKGTGQFTTPLYYIPRQSGANWPRHLQMPHVVNPATTNPRRLIAIQLAVVNQPLISFWPTSNSRQRQCITVCTLLWKSLLPWHTVPAISSRPDDKENKQGQIRAQNVQ